MATKRDGQPRIGGTPALALTRRRALALGGAAGTAALLAGVGLARAAAATGAAGLFRHGVASGDPLEARVVIWTRVSPASAASVPVRWQVGLTPDFAGGVVRQGTVATDASRDFTVKVDVGGLKAGTAYHYRFQALGEDSPVGRTRTLPRAGVRRLKLAVFSCSNDEAGFFHAYREAAARDDLDAVLHLGDYIYEYANGLETPATALGLAPIPRLDGLVPRAETVTLGQYRTRHALYKTDPDLRELHRRNPWITVWDDHEATNDGRIGGAENHEPFTEGSWRERRALAVRAYYEWMPIREPANGERVDPATGRPENLYRSFDFGRLARLVMLDTRLEGRDRQLEGDALVQTYATATPDGEFPLDRTKGGKRRAMVSPDQEAWLAERLMTSDQTWQLVGNQTLTFYQVAPDIGGSDALTPAQKADLIANVDAIAGPGVGSQIAALGAAGLPNPAVSTDAWTGYPTARLRFLGLLGRARNPIVLTGDSHNAWVANLQLPTAAGPAPVAVEFGGTSVTSPGFEQFLFRVPAPDLAALLIDSSERKSPTDKLIYAELARRGFMLVDVTLERVRVDHVFVSSVFDPAGYTTARVGFEVARGSRTAVPAA